MKILVLNGSPRPNGNMEAMVEAFAEGAKENGHEIIVVPVCQKKIAGCLACEYCHTKGEGRCILLLFHQRKNGKGLGCHCVPNPYSMHIPVLG